MRSGEEEDKEEKERKGGREEGREGGAGQLTQNLTTLTWQVGKKLKSWSSSRFILFLSVVYITGWGWGARHRR